MAQRMQRNPASCILQSAILVESADVEDRDFGAEKMLETVSVKRKRATEEIEEVGEVDAAVRDGGWNVILPIPRSLTAHASDASIIAPTIIDVSDGSDEEDGEESGALVGVAGSTAGSAAANVMCSTAGSAAANFPDDLVQTLAGASGLGYSEEELRYSLRGCCTDADAADAEDNEEEEDQKRFKCKVRNPSPCNSTATMLRKEPPSEKKHVSFSSSLSSSGVIRRSGSARVSHQSWSTQSFAGTRLCQQAGLSPLIWGASAAFAASMRGTRQVLAEHGMIAMMPSHLQVEAVHLLGEARAAGIQFHSTVGSVTVAAGEAKRLINSRLMMKSREFYVGITEDPARRFLEHQQNGYVQMDLFIFPSSAESGDCEIAILRSTQDIPNCQNRSGGGEVRSCREPHFCYIAWRP